MTDNLNIELKNFVILECLRLFDILFLFVELFCYLESIEVAFEC